MEKGRKVRLGLDEIIIQEFHLKSGEARSFCPDLKFGQISAASLFLCFRWAFILNIQSKILVYVPQGL